MAEVTLDSLASDLTRLYQKEKVILPFVRSTNEFLESMKEFEAGMRPGGSDLRYPIRLYDAHSVGAPNDGGDWSLPRQHASVQAVVTRAMFDASLLITLEAELAGQGDGSFSGDPLGEAIDNCVRVYAHQKNVCFLGHGTGRIGVVAADAVVTDTIVLDGPEFGFAFQAGMWLEFADLDTGGTVQALGGGLTEVKVLEVDLLTHTLTVSSNVTVSAAWGIYYSGTYGKRRPNGMRNTVDDGSLTSSYCSVSRATYPQINATILANSGALQDYTEALLRSLMIQIRQRSGMVPDVVWSNEGMQQAHFVATLPDRMFMQTGADVPKRTTGMNAEDLAIMYGGKRIPWKTDLNMVTRSIYALCKPGWRKHTLREDDWLKQGGAEGHVMLTFAPAAGGKTNSNNMIGSLQGNVNSSHKYLHAQGALLNVRDKESARD